METLDKLLTFLFDVERLTDLNFQSCLAITGHMDLLSFYHKLTN